MAMGYWNRSENLLRFISPQSFVTANILLCDWRFVDVYHYECSTVKTFPQNSLKILKQMLQISS